MGTNDKHGRALKAGAEVAKGGASQAGQATQNLFGRHGNQQLLNVVSGVDQKTEASVLQTAMASDTAQEAQQSTWWESEEQVARSAELEREDEQVQVAGREGDEASARESGPADRGSTLAPTLSAGVAALEADKDAQRGRQLTAVEEARMVESKRAQMTSGEIAEHEKRMLAQADAQNLSGEEKAEMLVAAGSVSDEVIEEQSGEVRAHLAAEHMPAAVAEFNREAAAKAAESPLDERDTIRNVTEEMRRIAQSIHKYPELADSTKSVEDKAAAMIRVLAMQLDVPTLESISAHPFIGLHEDLIFDPQAMLMVNQIAGSSHQVRTMGGFAMVAWQHIVTWVRDRLAAMDDKEQVEEDGFWRDALSDLSMKMYADALLKPAPV